LLLQGQPWRAVSVSRHATVRERFVMTMNDRLLFHATFTIFPEGHYQCR
jgi:hypothetical protein